MGKINWARVLLGGLLAGVVLNILDFIHNGMVMQARWNAVLEPLGRSMALTVADAVGYIVLDFAIGIAVVWLYAAARPRFGPGPKTAACTGLAFGIICFLFPTIGWGMLMKFPAGLLAIAIVWSLVEAVLASIVGAWPYKE